MGFVEARTKTCVSMRAKKEGLDFQIGFLWTDSRFQEPRCAKPFKDLKGLICF